jgi:tetratricopeptide (TPR) repeat protein
VATNKDKLIAGAQKLVEKGQFEKAIKEYLKVVADDDKDVRIWLKIGDLYAKLGKKPEAAETYAKVAQFYSDQGFYLKAVAVYKQILKIEPRLVDVNQKLAELYRQLGLLSDAMQQYEAVAAFHHREGKTREALAALKQIVELDPETVANRIKLAELYSKESMVREAIDEFSKAAEQLRQAGRVDDFMKVAERLLFHSPDNRPVTKELAGLYIEKGDPRRALPKLQVCFKADPRDTDVLSLLARAFEALDQKQKSVSVLKELARILGENGDGRGRDATWRKILQLAPGDPDAEAALTNPGRARPPSVPAIDADVASSVVARGSSTSAAGAGRNVTGGRPVVMSATGHVQSVREGDAPPEPEAAKPQKWEQSSSTPGRGVAGDSPVVNTAGAEEEIGRILNETDVYIKYNLHAKAIEHLQRAFERNPRHVGAREKLKALYLILGKKDEAVLELWSLVENAEPGRKRRYLREILEIDPNNARAAGELGEKLPPTTAALDEAASARDPEGTGNAQLLDVDDLEELDGDEFDVAEPSRTDARAADYVQMSSDEVEGEDDELIPVVVEPARERAVAAADDEVEDRFGFDHDAEPASGIEDRFGLEDDSAPMAPTDSEVLAVAAGADLVARGRRDDDDDSDVHTRFDDSPRKFDHGLLGAEVDEDDLPSVAALAGARTQQSPRLAQDDGDGLSPPVPTPVTRPDESGAVGTTLEDDLDEADFFVQQSLFDEARAILDTLLHKHPGHPLVTAKLRDLEAMERSSSTKSGDAVDRHAGAEPAEAAEMGAELPDELPGDVNASSTVGDPAASFEMTRKGVIEKGVTAEDFETHYDLGIAYKEMGLLDDAVNEFRIVMKDPAREVQCHLMIGLCFLEKGLQTDAIGQFKKGLYVEGITEREALSLYFELGQAYERLNDPREALYYYEKVIKRDPHFRDVEKRVETLRGGSPAPTTLPPGGGDDVDAAFDSLLGKDA